MSPISGHTIERIYKYVRLGTAIGRGGTMIARKCDSSTPKRVYDSAELQWLDIIADCQQ